MNAQNSGDALLRPTLQPSAQANTLQGNRFTLRFDKDGYPIFMSAGREYRFSTGDMVRVTIPDFSPAAAGFGIVVGFNWNAVTAKIETLPQGERRPIILAFPDGSVASVSLCDIGEEVVNEVDEQNAQFGEAANTLRWVAADIRNVLLTLSASQRKIAAKPAKHRWVSTRRDTKWADELRVA